MAVDTNTMLDRAKRLSSTQDLLLQELMQELDFYFIFIFNASTLYCKHYKVLQNKTLNK